MDMGRSRSCVKGLMAGRLGVAGLAEDLMKCSASSKIITTMLFETAHARIGLSVSSNHHP